MKLNLFSAFVWLLALSFFQHAVRAQDESRAAWQVTNFEITAGISDAERVLNGRANVSVRNVGGTAGTTLSLRINPKAEIKSVTVGSATASYQSRPETRGNSQRVTITLPSAVPSNQSVTATVEYRLPVGDNTGLAAISPVGSQFLPQSMWYPMANNAFAVRGADYAPFRLTVTGGSALSSGVDKSAGGNSVFEQTLNAQPFFVFGKWDRVEVATAKGISAYLPKGANADEQKQAEALIALANDARTFYAGLFGAAPDVPVRLISTTRGAGFEDAGTILLGEGSFRRKKIDAVTALSIGEAIARLWVGGDTTVRGEGHGVVREGLTRFLATIFIEKQFGADAAEAERARQRVAYSGVAKRDGPLSRTTPIDATYFNSVANKGAMVWRLMDHLVGRDAFVATLRSLLAEGKTNVDGLSLARARAAFVERRGNALKTVLDQELDQPTDMDLMAGLPQQQGGEWIAALRNLGSIDAVVNVTATTNSGQTVTAQATVPTHDFGQVSFKNAPGIVRIEIDPEKFYPQLDYANDVAPKALDVAVSLAEANRLYGAQEYAKAEALARQLLAASPKLQEGHIILGRALLAENKTDEAEKEFNQLMNDRLPTPVSLAWASFGLGGIALRRGKNAEAARNFSDAIRADAEYAATLTARAERIKAEPAGTVDEAVRSFINQLDTALRSGRQVEISPLMVPGELTRFVQQVVGTQPEAWQTRVLRTEQLDANRVAVDVALNTRQLGVDHAGTAVFILARVGGGYKLNAIELFEVR
ncbi:MAG TPA: tetratricopeptide repeat protein [Pyrinomonadaceae bacterium]|nr:tetratricopeptide repeat protein [Pyrinomonadaceae bacterium]